MDTARCPKQLNLSKMKKVLISLCLLASLGMFAQSTFITRTAYIRFFSTTPVEDIEAVNNQVSSVIDLAKSQLVFQVPMKAFVFERALMQEHFNENYVESDKYPNGTFKGKIVGLNGVEGLSKEPKQFVIEGTMTIKDATKDIKEMAIVSIVDGKIRLESVFSLTLADYNVSIPSAVRNKIQEKIEVTVKAEYSPK
jgi:hypothetical protein